MDATARAQLRDALKASEHASKTSCGFFACRGPDAPYVPMLTCAVCRTTQLLRRALRRLGLTEATT